VDSGGGNQRTATFSNFLGLPAIPARAGHLLSGTLPLHRILPRKFGSVADLKMVRPWMGWNMMEPTGQSSSLWNLHHSHEIVVYIDMKFMLFDQKFYSFHEKLW
jgi:hypothetical protein